MKTTTTTTTNGTAPTPAGYRKTRMHNDLVRDGKTTLFRDGKAVRTFASYELAIQALEAAKGQGWHI